MSRLRTLPVADTGDALVIALLVGCLVEAWFRAPGWRWAAIAPFAILWTLPLLLRRRSAILAGLVVLAAAAASVGVTGGTVASGMWVAMVAAFAVIGLHEDRARAVAGGTLGYVLLLVVAITDQGLSVYVLVVAAIFAGGPLAAGAAVRARAGRAAELAELARRLERMRDEDARIAGAEERARIVAELNEVVARAVAAMTVQAGAARLMLDQDTAKAREAIAAVEDAGRDALAETRRLLGVLRQDLAEPERQPQPGLAALERLVEDARGAGIEVEMSIEGDQRPLTAGVDLAAYRLVEEGLRAARGVTGVVRVAIALRWRPDALEIRVANDGGASGASMPLAALRERLALYGGTVAAERALAGRTSTTAVLPFEGAL